MIRCIFGFAVLLFMMSGCVSLKKYETLQIQADSCAQTGSRQQAAMADLHKQILALEGSRTQLLRDSLMRHRAYVRLQGRYEKLLAQGSAEAALMLKNLRESQEELSSRSHEIQRLESMLRGRDEALRSIKGKVSEALLGFEGKGLTVTQRGGKVYVSMDDKLLFSSGSFEIEQRGAEAIAELGKVLAANRDISMVVEGHTDSIPYRGSGQVKDNWDLSVKRATTVVRLLLENSEVNPQQVTASGCGPFNPVDRTDSPEARQRNRRTEIILTPKLDELIKLTTQETLY